MKHADTENYLIIGPSWVGDMVMAQALFISLKQQQPDCRITVLGPARMRSLADRMPEVDEAIDLELEHGDLRFATRRQIGKSLKSAGYSTAIVLPNSFKSALIPYHAAIRRRVGWRGEWRNLLLTDCRKLDESEYPLMAQRYVALAYPGRAAPPTDFPRPRLSTDPRSVAATRREFKLNTDSRIMAICPGAEFGEAKQWPPQHYAALCETMTARGRQVWMFGSHKDCLTGEAIQADLASEHLAGCVNLIGRTSLAQAIDLLSLVDVVVSNDSGLMHIGAGLQKPVVAMFGSTSPDFTPPLAERVKLLATDIECRPCFERRCPFGHLRCLTELKPEMAIDAVDELFGSV